MLGQFLNIISKNASTVGSYDLNVLNSRDGYNNVLEDLKKNKFKIVFLYGQDNIKFDKKNEFVVYIGTHGDRGAEIADVILPSATFTEQDGYFTNLEGKMQKAYKANYPPGEAKEDWVIVNELSLILNNKKLFNTKDNLVDSMINYLKIAKKNHLDINTDNKFQEEKIIVDQIDYYYSNVIARASKTMSECRHTRLNIKSTGTEG